VAALTSDVLLRDVTESDLPVFFEHQFDPEANRMAAFPARDRDAFMSHWFKILADDSLVKKTVVVDGEVAGNVVSFLSKQSGKTEVGYWIGKKYWGKGIATKALSQFLILVEERPLYAGVAKHNIGSIRVLEKCGFALVDEHQGSKPGDVEEYLFELRADASR
jgi:RimJ/RimL family protein N-acetyltransferase